MRALTADSAASLTTSPLSAYNSSKIGSVDKSHGSAPRGEGEFLPPTFVKIAVKPIAPASRS